MKTIVLIIVAAIVAPVAALFLVSTGTEIQAKPGVLGAETPVAVRVANPHGVRKVRLVLAQDQARSEVSQEWPARRFVFTGTAGEPANVTLTVPAKPDNGFKSGPAKLTVEATSNDFRGKTDAATLDVTIDLRPPNVVPDGAQHYINQGGAEMVTFTISGYWSEAGVRVGKYTFRSFPMPGSSNPNSRFALFAYPWDLPADVLPVVYAKGAGGQEVTAQFWYKLTPRKFRQREIELNDKFMQKVTGELDPGGGGSLLDRFLKINRDMRVENNQTLQNLRLKSEEKFLWRPPFLQLGNSKVEAQFADVRSYLFEKKKVDEQVHLGFDLSVTANVPVVAANDGRVVWAAPLGIYGNCIVVDHGYGLQSIYGHLSSIGVKEGDMVKKQQTIGKSGATGLAGGDHLHYSMQLDGVQVNPVEWWDAHWIQDRVLSKLPEGLVTKP